MRVYELVEQHGLPIKVTCGKPTLYPDFTVMKKLTERTFLCQYDDGKTFELVDHSNCNDYELVALQTTPVAA